MFKYCALFIPVLVFWRPVANAQIGVGTLQYQWAGLSNSTGGIYHDTLQYTFYPDGNYLYKVTGTNSRYEIGKWRVKNRVIFLNHDKGQEEYAYQGTFKLRKNSIKWIIDPEAVAYLGRIGYWWFSWTKALKYKRLKH